MENPPEFYEEIQSISEEERKEYDAIMTSIWKVLGLFEEQKPETLRKFNEIHQDLKKTYLHSLNREEIHEKIFKILYSRENVLKTLRTSPMNLGAVEAMHSKGFCGLLLSESRIEEYLEFISYVFLNRFYNSHMNVIFSDHFNNLRTKLIGVYSKYASAKLENRPEIIKELNKVRFDFLIFAHSDYIPAKELESLFEANPDFME